jgi:hypothetical protein
MKNTAISIGQFWINKLSLACACVVLGLGYAAAQPAATAADTSITAIDILLLPDATMIQRAEAVNKRLRSVFPKGFSLDASHHPHISMFQCFVHTADLAKVFAAADKVFASGNVTNLKLTAFKYYYIPDKDLGLSGIVIKPTAELIKVQSDLIAAVAPLTVKTATSAAFVTTPENPDISPLLIHYVEVFATEHTGTHFEPHVTTGIAPRDYLDKMLAEPFADFTFSPAGAAVYHLGEYGTAAKKLTDLNLYTPQRKLDHYLSWTPIEE